MIPANIALAIVILPYFHYTADWLMQTREMAEKKGSDIKTLLAHCYIYAVFCPFALSVYLAIENVFTWHDVVAYTLFNFAAHLVTDYFTSMRSARLWKLEDKTKFWNNIGLDQTIHFITLYASLLLLIYVSGQGR